MYYCNIETEGMLGQSSTFWTKLHLAHYSFHDQVYYQVHHLSGLIFVHAIRDMRTLNFSRFDIIKMNTHVLLLLLPPRNLIFASFV